MLEDCLSMLDEYNVDRKAFVVPGAYELPSWRKISVINSMHNLAWLHYQRRDAAF